MNPCVPTLYFFNFHASSDFHMFIAKLNQAEALDYGSRSNFLIRSSTHTISGTNVCEKCRSRAVFRFKPP